MGLFFHRDTSSTASTVSAERTTEEKAFDYFDGEAIRCASSVDRSTVELIYKSLKVNNYDTSSESDMRDGLQTLDNNVYHFAQALIYQNFMLMRKVDNLSERLQAMEDKLDK